MLLRFFFVYSRRLSPLLCGSILPVLSEGKMYTCVIPHTHTHRREAISDPAHAGLRVTGGMRTHIGDALVLFSLSALSTSPPARLSVYM